MGKRKLSLSDAIKHCEEVAEANEKTILYYTIQGDKEWLDECEKDCIECAEEHRQLAEWLKELKKYKEGIDQIKELTDDYKGWDNWDIVKGLQYALECLEVKTDDGDCN